MCNVGLIADVVLLANGREYVLYNYKTCEIMGYISILTDNGGYTYVHQVAAEKGYGPLLHDIVMMYNFPREVRSDDDLTEGSIKIWNYYFDNRTDVIKSKIPKEYCEYVRMYYDDESLQYSYRLEKSQWFIDFINDSKSLIYVNEIDVEGILIDGKFYFYNKYNDYVTI